MRLAAEGDIDAQFSLAIAYAVGRGVRKDLKRARHWYGLAAGRGESDATFNYATMVLFGEGGVRSALEGMKWLRKASREGSTDADILLGDLCASGAPMRAPAARTAARHYARAALRGDVRGLRNLTVLLAGAGERIADAIRAGVEAAGRSR
jgi:TPR repeat protein